MADFQPLMAKSEIRSIEKAFLDQKKLHLRILEWGSGGSTLHFTNFLRKHDISYEWISLEYNRRWYNNIAHATKPDSGITMVLFDVGNDHLYQRDTDMDEYVAYPSTLGKAFDLVLVDGRKRRRCVLEAKKILTPDGVVFLHDAQRHYYHSALRKYPDSRFITLSLWRGKSKPVSFLARAHNTLITLGNRALYLTMIAPFHFIKRRVRRPLYRM